MPKYRIYELAKMFNKTNNEIIEILRKNNVEVKNQLNSVDEKAKTILENVLSPKPKKKVRRMARTVRFDQEGRPMDGKEKGTGRKSYSSYSVVQNTEGKPAAKAEARKKDQAPASSGEQEHHNHAGNREGEQHEHMADHRHEARPASDRRTPAGRQKNDRNEPGHGMKKNYGEHSFEHHERGERKGETAHAGRVNRPFSHAEAKTGEDSSRSTQRRPQPLHKKTKKDWERSRREKEGGSLMARSLKQKKNKKHSTEKKETAYPTEVKMPESVTVKQLADLFKREVSEVIKHLMADGVMATINQNLDKDTVEILADEFGVKLLKPDKEDDPAYYKPAPDDPKSLKPCPPVVTIMGHVDHGKTTLLDALRKTNVAEHEAGGITQKIGAYQVRYKGRKITFLDTPGHEAFTAMRARGAQITNIAVLVVAADDGVMPQTIEAIHHAKNAGVPIVVAINKIDKPGANPDRIKEELSKQGLLAEDWGGDVIMVPISAKKRIGLDDLLENILLVADVLELKANPNREAYGVVVEARLDKGRGPVMNVLVQDGTLHVGDSILAGSCWGHVRAMINEQGKRIKSAEPSAPAEVLGMNSVPEAGDHFYVMDEKKARRIAELRASREKEKERQSVEKVTLDNIFEKIKEGEMKELNVIVKADVQGSVEALVQSLQGIKSTKVRITIVHSAVGAITESDVMLASASHALILGFNVRPDAKARTMAEDEGVTIRTYRVIYDLIDDVKNAMAGLLAPKITEKVIGHAEVRQVIHTPKVIVAGSYVEDGKVTSNCQLRLIRDGIVVHEGKIGSLRRFKDDVKEVAQGNECGITLENYRDIKEGDQLEAYELEEEAAKLE